MIFKQAQQILDGAKTQTRRPVKEGERCRDGRTVSRYWISRFRFMADGLDWDYRYPKWQVGRTYAVQPGRGKKSIGRIRITKIRRERLHEISPADNIEEGFGVWVIRNHAERRVADVVSFMETWDSLYHKPYRWEDNPEVWVLDFEKVRNEDDRTHPQEG